MNICTFGSFFAMFIACTAYFDCVAYDTPCGSGGLVSWPYSVIHTGTTRWKNFLRSASNFGKVESVTFGYRTFCVGARFGDVGYGWCAHASNFSPGVCATSFTNVPAATDALIPASVLSRPRAEVSPIATFASELPDLIPAYAALKSFA